MIPRYFVVAEREHELQNPTSEEKLLLLGRRIRLGLESRVLDVASGRGGPAILLAREFGCTIEGVEIAPEFHAAAVERAARDGVGELVSFRLADAAYEELAAGAYDFLPKPLALSELGRVVAQARAAAGKTWPTAH